MKSRKAIINERDTGIPKWLKQAAQIETNRTVRFRKITSLKSLKPENSSKKWSDLGLVHPLAEITQKITGSEYPYTHQAKTIQTILGKAKNKPRKVILRGGTHSGKSLAFLLPALSLLLEQKIDFVIIFYPMKQLIEDQFFNLKKLLVEIQKYTGRAITARIYHGERGLAKEEKIAWKNELKEIERNPPNILLATFDKVWYQLIHYPEKENELLKRIINAQYLVFDEIHSLKGLPAAYIHYFLKPHSYRNPNNRVIISTATIANVDEFQKEFLRSVNLNVDKKRNTDVVVYESNPVRGKIDVLAISAESFLPLLTQVKRDLTPGKIALVFVDSKRKIEEYAKRLGFHLKKDQAIYDSGSIGVLHANLHQKIRKQALIDARKGRLKILLTSAVMELGIDLENIETIINVGWPVSGKDGLLQRIGRDRSKPGDQKVVYLIFDQENARDQLYYSNLSLIQKILEEYQCTPILFPKKNQKVITSAVILLLIYGYWKYSEIISFFEEKTRRTAKKCLTNLIAHGIIKKDNAKISLVGTTSREFRQLISSGIRAIGSNWKIVFELDASRKILGFCSTEEILRGRLPGNVLLINKIPYQVRAVNKKTKEVLVELTTLSSTFELPINILKLPEIRMGFFQKKMRVSSGLLYQFGEIIISKSPKIILKPSRLKKGKIQRKELDENESKKYTLEIKSEGILVEIGNVTKDPLLASFSNEMNKILACLRILLKTQIELSLQIVQSEIAIVYNNIQLAIYDKGGGNGNSKYLYKQLPVIVEEAFERLKHCSCSDGCEKCFGRDFSKYLPRGKSKAILLQLLDWLH